MKICDFNVNGNTISFSNSYWGTEQVFLNNKEISKKYSWFGKTHEINLENDYYYIKTSTTLKKKGMGVSASLFNGANFIDKKSKVVYTWKEFLIMFGLIIIVKMIINLIF